MGRALGRRVRLPGPSRKLGQRPSAANARPIALLSPLALLTSYKNDVIILYHFFYRPLLAFRLQFNHSAVNTIGCKQFLG